MDLVLATASEMGIRHRVVGSPYGHPAEAAEVASRLEEVCRVLVFTGRVPFELANQAGEGRSAETLFVPHGGATLYRALALLLIDNGGVIPYASIDTIAADDVEETYREICQDVPRSILPASDPEGASRIRDIDTVVSFHREALAAGKAQIALTCLEAAFTSLSREGLPVRRIAHTRSAIRAALDRAVLADDLEQSRSTQVTVVLVRTPSPRVDADLYSLERERLRQRETLLNLGERLKGHLVAVDDRNFLIPTSRGAVDALLASSGSKRTSITDDWTLPVGTEIGIGLGSSMAAAEQCARRALELGLSDDRIHMLLPSGEVWPVDGTPIRRGLAATDPRAAAVASTLGLGALSLSRMIEALSRLDASHVTAGALADEYGVQVRSARRLLTALRRSGYAHEIGTIMTARIGRPQVVYSVDVSRLAEEATGQKEFR